MKISKMSVELLGHLGDDLTCVNAARVSFHKESEWELSSNAKFKGDENINILSEKDIKLINYLAKHNHWSPFAHTALTFRIKAPIFVARQLVKHQVGGVWNEVSRRYVSDEPEFYFPEVWRGKPENAKQGSSGIFDMKFFVEGNKEIMGVHSHNLCYSALQLYNQAIHNGMAPEQARMVLPQNTMTEWWWTGSLVFFARVCKQRLDSHAQQETQEIAKLLNDAIEPIFPISWRALMEN